MTSAGTAVEICLVGAAGRLGSHLLARLPHFPSLHLASVWIHRRRPEVASPVRVTNDLNDALQGVQAVIDFSAPPVAASLLPSCVRHGVAAVVASTALSEADERAIDEAAQSIAVLQAANTSIGVNVLLELSRQAAQQLPAGFAIEVSELHHGHKRDAPSGTAVALAATLSEARGGLREVRGRDGVTGERAVDEIGISALRGGDVAGEHTVFFLGSGERIELTHRASTPAIFADGALRAAAWLVEQAPGRYTMQDLLRAQR